MSGAGGEQARVAAGGGRVDAEVPLERVALRREARGLECDDRRRVGRPAPGAARAASLRRRGRRRGRGRADRAAPPGRSGRRAPATGRPAAVSGASAAAAPCATTSTALPRASAWIACASASSAPAPSASTRPRGCRLSRLLSPVGPGRSSGLWSSAAAASSAGCAPRALRSAATRSARVAQGPASSTREGGGDVDRGPGRRAGRRGVLRPLQARQVVRAARLGAGARQALAAEGLRADDGADLVAVDVDVAGVDARGDALDPVVDAAVQAEGQAVAAGVDRVDHPVEVGGAEGRDMQHRAEDLALERCDPVDGDHRGRRRSGRPRAAASVLSTAAGMGADVGGDALPRPRRRSPGRRRWRGPTGRRAAARPSRPPASRARGRGRPPARRAGAAPSSAGRRTGRPRRARRAPPARSARWNRRSWR